MSVNKNYKMVISDTNNCKTYIADTPKVLNRIAEQYIEQEKEILKLKHQLDKFDAEVAKTNSIRLLKSNIARMRKKYSYGFYLTKEENEKVREWIKNHNYEVHAKTGPGDFSYEFNSNTLIVYCNKCKEKAFIKSHGDIKKYEELLNKYDAKIKLEKDAGARLEDLPTDARV